ncbi:MAG: hypothetical protein P8Z68_07965, partial [Kineosporiaceae bacterium]
MSVPGGGAPVPGAAGAGRYVAGADPEWAARAGADPRPLVPVSEFGPFDVLSDQAHARYLDGDAAAAVAVCARALPVVEAAGDRQTARYLRYIHCLSHEMEGQWSRLRRCTEDLLQTFDDEPGAGPYWRAKVLGLHAHALIQQGRPAPATAALAEAYALVMDNPGVTYNRGSACHAVSVPLYSALLFEPAVDLLRTAQRMHRSPGPGLAFAAVEEAAVHATWGLLLELVGLERQADARYAVCASTALRAGAAAGGASPWQDRASALLQFAYQRLRCGVVDERVLRAEAASGSVRATVLPRLVLLSARGRRGETAGMAEELGQLRDDARRLGELVVEWVTSAWLAELHESGHAPSESTRRWRDLALGTLERLWHDREGRFEHLLARRRTAALRVRLLDEHTRLWQDALTGVGNRRMLDDLLAVPGAGNRPVVFLDID